MLLKEKFNNTDSNLFELMSKVHPLPWVDYDFINTYWLSKYGELMLASAYEEMNVGIIANMVSCIVADKWDIQYSNYHLNLLLDGNKSETVTHTIKDSNESKVDSTGTQTHKISAFDSTDLVDDNTDDTTGSTNTTGSNTREETTVTNAKSGNFINDMISYNKYLTNIGFYDMIISDVNKCVAFTTQELNF